MGKKQLCSCAVSGCQRRDLLSQQNSGVVKRRKCPSSINGQHAARGSSPARGYPQAQLGTSAGRAAAASLAAVPPLPGLGPPRRPCRLRAAGPRPPRLHAGNGDGGARSGRSTSAPAPSPPCRPRHLRVGLGDDGEREMARLMVASAAAAFGASAGGAPGPPSPPPVLHPTGAPPARRRAPRAAGKSSARRRSSMVKGGREEAGVGRVLS